MSRTSARASVATTPAGADPGKSSRSVTAPELSPLSFSSPDPVREFIRAFNDQDLDAFVAVLDPEVELHASRGLRKGLEAARVWATKAPGGVQQTIELEQLYEDGTESGGGRAVALICRRWHWEEDRSEAGVDEMAWAFELRDQKVLSWRPFDDRAEALRQAHFLPG